MNSENNKKTKELELGTDTTSNVKDIDSNKESKSADRVINENNTNSFYEGGSKKTESTWLEDWRGKTLIFIILLLILIGIAIPSGMASAGYFKDKGKVPNFTLEEKEVQVKKDINHMMDIAVVDNYDAMINQGYYNKSFAENKLEDINNDIDDQIQKEIDNLKDIYGKSWKEEWDKELFDKGFDTEKEYRSSLKASKLKYEQIEKYSSASLYTSKVNKTEFFNTLPGDPQYVSGTDDKGSVTYINNDYGVMQENNITTYDGDINIISPEDLTYLYVKYYEPLAFNSSTIELTTIGDDGSTTIDPDLISISKENLQKIRHLGRSLNNDTLLPQNNPEGSIQSRINIDLSPAANAAIYSYIAAGNFENNGGLFNYAKNLPYSENQINAMTNNDLENEAKNILNLKYFLKDSPSGYRSMYFTEKASNGSSLSKNGDYNNATYVSYLDTDGIHYIGVTAQGKEIVTNFLNKKNKTTGLDIPYNEIPDLGFQDSLKSFITENAETIILINQIYDFKNSEFDQGKITEILGKVNEGTDVEEKNQTTTKDIIDAIPFYINKYNSKQISSTYYGVVDYAKENRKVFDYEKVKSDSNLINAVSDFELYKLVNSETIVKEISSTNKTTKRGDQFE